MADVQDIISRLLDKTDQGKISWRPMASEDTFATVVGSWSVSVSIPRHLNLPTIRIHDGTGQLLEQQSPNPADSDYSLLQELHRKAKRSALGIDHQLEGLLAELDKV